MNKNHKTLKYLQYNNIFHVDSEGTWADEEPKFPSHKTELSIYYFK